MRRQDRPRVDSMWVLRPCGCGVYPFHAGDCWTLDIPTVKEREAEWRDKLFGGRCQARLPRVGIRIRPAGGVYFEGRCVMREHETWVDHAVYASWNGHLLVNRWTTETTSHRGEGLP